MFPSANHSIYKNIDRRHRVRVNETERDRIENPTRDDEKKVSTTAAAITTTTAAHIQRERETLNMMHQYSCASAERKIEKKMRN